MITQSEFMRRMKEMSATGGWNVWDESNAEMYNLVVNGNHPMVSKILAIKDAKKQKSMIKELQILLSYLGVY